MLALRGVVSTHVRRYLLLFLEKIVTLHIDNLRAYFIYKVEFYIVICKTLKMSICLFFLRFAA